MKVLVAEDDLNIREGLCDLLEQEGYHCIEAADGNQALKLWQDKKPDLVLLDIMMPGQDGYSVCRQIRQQDQQLPVIFITAKSEEIDQVVGLELGADDYIKKPFGTREVIARIRAVTRRALQQQAPSQQAEGMLEFGELQLFPDQLRARRGEQQIDLSLRDVRIMQLMHHNRGRVVSRDELFDAGWGRDYMPSSRTLDQTISQLRKRIEADPRQPQIIKTVHGIGYRFDG